MPQEGVAFHATTQGAKPEALKPPLHAQIETGINHLGYNKFQATC